VDLYQKQEYLQKLKYFIFVQSLLLLCSEIEIFYIWAVVAAAVRATRPCVLLPMRLDSSTFPLTQQMLGWFATIH
jgi:hypothetical protein